MKWPELNLTKDEWQELVAIEYVLTWNYCHPEEIEGLEKRQAYLRTKREPPTS